MIWHVAQPLQSNHTASFVGKKCVHSSFSQLKRFGQVSFAGRMHGAALQRIEVDASNLGVEVLLEEFGQIKGIAGLIRQVSKGIHLHMALVQKR